MSDAIDIEGHEYVSAKRAAKETGYSRDYIGQLARGGHISARRVEGLWYVSLDSLKAYMTKAAEYKSEPPVSTTHVDSDANITFDGKEYISAANGAKLTGYHQDYVSQLARSGKISSRQVGNRWFVEREALVTHKKQKDALLAAVQAESVGLSAIPSPTTHSDRSTSHTFTKVSQEPYDRQGMFAPNAPATVPASPVPIDSYYSYHTERRDLLPKPSSTDQLPTLNQIRTTPVHRLTHKPTHYASQASHANLSYGVTQTKQRRRVLPIKHKSSVRFGILAPAALTVVVVLTFSFTSLKEKAVYAINSLHGTNATSSQQTASVSASATAVSIASWIESFFARDIEYKAIR